jgi:hypothetical protein
MNLSDVVRQMTAAGCSNEQIGAVSAGLSTVPVRSANAERQARFRAKKKSSALPVTTTVDVTESVIVDVTVTENEAPLARVFSIGEEEVITPSLRSGGAFAPGEQAIGQYRDAKHELWGEGKKMLADLGISKSQAGELMGRWMKETGDNSAGVLDAIRRAREFKPVNPIPWIFQALPGKQNNNGKSVHAAVKRLCEDVADGSITFGPPPEPYVLVVAREREREKAIGLLPKG